jgi:hypothetical protein
LAIRLKIENALFVLTKYVILGFEDSHNPDDVLSADGALRQLLSAVDACCHVAALQHDAIHGCIPTNLAKVLIRHCVFL